MKPKINWRVLAVFVCALAAGALAMEIRHGVISQNWDILTVTLGGLCGFMCIDFDREKKK